MSPDLKQVQAGLAVAGDGGVPVLHRAFDRGAAEVSQVVGAMTALRKIAGPRKFLLVGDSKLISYATCGTSPESVAGVSCCSRLVGSCWDTAVVVSAVFW